MARDSALTFVLPSDDAGHAVGAPVSAGDLLKRERGRLHSKVFELPLVREELARVPELGEFPLRLLQEPIVAVWGEPRLVLEVVEDFLNDFLDLHSHDPSVPQAEEVRGIAHLLEGGYRDDGESAPDEIVVDVWVSRLALVGT